jgi:cold shock CspA family protein
MSEIGQVVWFDRKKGFGFVKVVNPESELFEKELFIHYTSINCVSSFKILYPGETISMDVEKNVDQSEGQKEYTVSNVGGVYGAPLMIDNDRYIFKVIRKSIREEGVSSVGADSEEHGGGDGGDGGDGITN